MTGTGEIPSQLSTVPWCSLITVTHNSADALREFWRGAAERPVGVEWIVVDNGSSDDSVAVAKELGASTVIVLSRNRGFSHANNVGFLAATGGFTGFVNPDVSVGFDALPALRELAESRRALVSPQLLNQDGTLQPNGRGFPLLIDKVRNRLSGAETLDGRYLLYGLDGRPRPVCWLMGASILGMREDLQSISAWDPSFFLYYEDKDICLRAWEAGLAVVLEPRVRWTHGWARETAVASATPWKRELASMARFYTRYPEFLFWRGFAARIRRRIQREVFGAAT